LKLQADYDDVYSMDEVKTELKIKTHYEGLDIAESNRIHYLCFSLPESLPGVTQDQELKEFLKLNNEGVV
jgi:tRNA (guanine-N7-)-methyltransferase